MPIPTPTEIKTTLLKRFSTLATALVEYRSVRSTLKSIGAGLDLDVACTYSCVIDIVDSYFESLRANVQKHYAQNSPVEIVIPVRYYKFDKAPRLGYSFRRKLRDIEDLPEAAHTSLLSEYVDRIELDKIHDCLNSQVYNLASSEMRIHINELISTMAMEYAHKPIKATARSVAISKDTTNYYHNHGPIEAYKRFSQALESVESETGYLFGGGVNEFIDVLMSLSHSNQSIASRTSFGSRESIEIYCYKSKYEFRFSPPAFAAIEAFILVHGCDKSIETVNEFKDRASEVMVA